jgi:hypothetical protein
MKKKKSTPWVEPPAHPAFEKFKIPMMGPAEIKELAEDIKKNGKQVSFKIWVEDREDPNGAESPFS